MTDDTGSDPLRPRRITTGLRMPRLATPVPPELRPRLRTRLVIAMAIAALVPVAIVAVIATRVILSNLEDGLREDADRQLTVGLNLVLRNVERLGDESVQMSENSDLAVAFENARGSDPPPGSMTVETWFSRESAHVPSSRLQLLDLQGGVIFDRVVGGASARFRNVGITKAEIEGIGKDPWNRGISLVAEGGGVVLRAISPVVDTQLFQAGVLVLSVPLDGDFADGIKGALSADVMIGGRTGPLAVTFRSALGRRGEPIEIDNSDRRRALGGARVSRDLDTQAGHYAYALAALHDRHDNVLGLIGVAVDREPLARTQSLAVRSLAIGGFGALVFALVLALLWSRRLGRPIAKLHRGAIAVSRGDLDHRIEVSGDDELTDLASAFNQMTGTLKDNQARLAARMREMVALHDAGRAVSSVIDLDSVSRKIVDAVARTFDVQVSALWINEGGAAPGLRASAVRARRADQAALAASDAIGPAETLEPIATSAATSKQPIRIEQAEQHESGYGGIIALPLVRQTRVVGVLAVARSKGAREFSEADVNLLTTFADQAGAAVENALLYREVRGASEELEKKVRLRTAELTAINSELGRALGELRDAQSQLVLSERMAGLGLLVAGVAHEINSPTAAIRGSIDGLGATLARVARQAAEIASRASPKSGTAIVEYLAKTAPRLAERPLQTGLAARRAARELTTALDRACEQAIGNPIDTHALATELADLGASAAEATALIEALGPDRALASAVTATLVDHVYLHRTAHTVGHAVGQIQRIVGALKSYSHLDQQPTRSEADLHEGIDTTLILLHYALRDIVVERDFGDLPRVPVFVDELNQVWTNLISNAQQALAGKGTIHITTVLEGDAAVVRVIDNGPGIPEDVLPRIFEPFFTTKPKGEGTGLGLGICRQIIAKHGGSLTCESSPGRTCFEVRLPTSGAAS